MRSGQHYNLTIPIKLEAGAFKVRKRASLHLR